MSEKREEVNPEQIRRDLLELAGRIRRLDELGELLHATPELMKRMGDLRRKLFEYEVRCTGRLLPEPVSPEVLEAQRIVEEAARRMEEEQKRWGRGWTPDLEEEEG